MNILTLPCPVSQVSRALPHRPPMIWLSEVLDAARDGGICAADLNPAGLYAGADGECLDFAPVEWMAEAYGYTRAAHAYAEGNSSYGLKKAYLVGVGHLELHRPIPSQGRILVEVRTSREMAPLVLVRGEVRSETGEVYADAQLKLYFEE